jgi:mono/diheme cytochrome c family protein
MCMLRHVTALFMSAQSMTPNSWRLPVKSGLPLGTLGSMAAQTSIGIVLALAAAANRADANYAGHIKPLLAEKCVSCHGPLKQEAGLRLDAIQLIRKGSESGQVAIAGAPADSLLLARVAAPDAGDRMPPEGEGSPLNAEQIAMLKAWIEGGLEGPAEEPVLKSPKEHWAYQPVVRPPIPTGHGSDGNPIDAFLAAARSNGGVEAIPAADSSTLLRRLSLDLIGLPPTVAELQSFLADDSEAAYLREVDRLLDSPQHGERWARHWMDVWRYSDWDGYKDELRGSQRHIWRWRDWIVESLNADKGYDRMIAEMLAGDELAPEDNQILRATGFLARNYHHSNRDIWLDAAVEHTAKAFLGMTLNCARCHDHKFDPIEQREYFAFRAIFEPYRVRTDRIPGEANPQVDGLPRVYDADLESKTHLYISGNEKQPDTANPLQPATPQAIDLGYDVTAVSLPIAAYFPALAPHRERDELDEAERAQREAEGKLKSAVPGGDSPDARQRLELAAAAADARLESLRARWAADKAKYTTAEQPSDSERREELTKTAAIAERRFNVAEAKLDRFDNQASLDAIGANQEADPQKRKTARNKARKQLKAAEKKLVDARQALKERASKYTPVGEEYPRTSTGRRLALARWITDPHNPLAARVAVNHIWLRHYGEPLVEEVFDFGLRSPRPLHADLLDWLAAEFVESGWSMKHLHRLLVTSQAYRLASSGDAGLVARNSQADPDNRLWWRADVRRLEAEVIRDSLLHVAGKLDLARGGPDIDFNKGEAVPRRSIYFRHAYEKQMQMLVMFDAASPTECYRRGESIIPQQALALANSSLGVSVARQLAGKLHAALGESGDATEEFIEQAFLTVLCRQPADQERNLCREFLQEQPGRLTNVAALTPFGGTVTASTPPAGEPPQRARENLVHVLLNHNDFVSVR